MPILICTRLFNGCKNEQSRRTHVLLNGTMGVGRFQRHSDIFFSSICSLHILKSSQETANNRHLSRITDTVRKDGEKPWFLPAG